VITGTAGNGLTLTVTGNLNKPGQPVPVLVISIQYVVLAVKEVVVYGLFVLNKLPPEKASYHLMLTGSSVLAVNVVVVPEQITRFPVTLVSIGTRLTVMVVAADVAEQLVVASVTTTL
jgi:hypothetical protein